MSNFVSLGSILWLKSESIRKIRNWIFRYPDIRIVDIFSTTLVIIHAKFHKSRFNIVAVKWKYPKKFKTGYPKIRIVHDLRSDPWSHHAKFRGSRLHTAAVYRGMTWLQTETGTGNYILRLFTSDAQIVQLSLFRVVWFLKNPIFTHFLI